MATLTNTKIKDTYDGLLKTTDNDVIGASEKVITDGLGNATVLSIGTASASFSSDIEVNTLTIGLGSGSIATNTAIGLDALLSNTSGSGNVSVGQGSMRSNTTGLGNVSIGKDALRLNTTGNYNVAVGYIALYNNIDGADNVAVGYSSLNANTSGSQNIAIGRQALLANTTGGNNTAIGYSSLVGNITGGNNTAVGRSSLYANTASNNTAVGAYALLDNTTGGANTALGSNALKDNTTGQSNTAIGKDSLSKNTTGNYNASLGTNTLQSNTEGDSNVAVGYSALEDNTTGVRNIAIGHTALDSNTTGQDNVSIGHQSIYLNTTGNSNTAVGSFSLRNNTASGNTALGSYALNANISSSQNTAVGADALRENTASSNTALGYYALGLNTTGAYNTAIGSGAGDTNTTGSSNVYIGYNAVGSAATNDNEIVIGSSATGNGSNTATYGNSSITGHYFEGDIILTDGSNPVLSVQDTLGGSSFLKLLAGDTGTSNIYLGDDSDENAGAIVYDHSDNSMSFRTNGFLEKMSIDSSGVVITGTVDINSNSLQLTGATNPQVLVTDTTNSVSVGLQALDASTKIDSTHSFKIEIGNDIIQSVTSSGVEITGNLAVDTNTLYVDAANNRVGIGTSSPAVGLHSYNNTSMNQLTVDGTGAIKTGINFASGGTTYGQIYFDNNAPYDLSLYQQYTTGSLIFGTNSTERMRIDSNGNVGIGVVPSNYAGYTTLCLNDTSGSQVEFFSSGVQKAYIEGTAGILKFQHNDTSPIVFSTNATERMRIDSSGRVLVNTATAQNTATGRGNITINGTTSILNLATSDTNSGYIYHDSTNMQVVNAKNGFMNFYTNDTERMCIDSSGNVGIGESNPTNTLTIKDEGYQIAIIDESSGNVSEILSSNDSMGFFADRGNAIADSKMLFSVDGSERMRINSSGQVLIGGSATPSIANTKLFISRGDQYGLHLWANGATNSANIIGSEDNLILGSAGSERMRITSGGHLFVNTDVTPDASNGGFGVFASGGSTYIYNSTEQSTSWFHLQFINPNGIVGSISTNGSATAFNTSSDYRLKENVVEMTGALDRVDALKPSRFNFIADPEKTVDGFIAHEVQAIVPEAVTGEKDAVDEEGNPIYQGIDQSKIVPLLVGAIKELSAKVAALESQLNA